MHSPGVGAAAFRPTDELDALRTNQVESIVTTAKRHLGIELTREEVVDRLERLGLWVCDAPEAIED